MSKSLDGLVVAVTGAGRGIGRSEVLALAAQGARVVINDVDHAVAEAVADEVRAVGGEAVAHLGDCSEEEAAGRLVTEAVERFGQLDALVNNAGILRDASLVKMPVEAWDVVVKVHLRGHFLTTQAACRYWRESGRPGRVVNTTSTSGLLGTFGQTNYGAAKAGIAALTVIAALEMATAGVTVNAIAPAGRTRLTGGEEGALAAGDGFDFWDPDNVAPVVAWLCSPDSAGISGNVFGVQGDVVELFAPWESRAVVRNGSQRWTAKALSDAVPRLFEESGLEPGAYDPMTRLRFTPASVSAEAQ